MDELLADFLTETGEAIAAIDDALVRWERDPGDRATLDSIFRLVHTVKGGCGFLDLPRLEALAHAAETVLGRVRDGKLAVSEGLISGVLAAIDGIKGVVAVIGAKGSEPEGADAALISRLEQIAEGIDVAAPAAEESADVRAAQAIRVPVALLERLMDTVSELVVTRNRLVQLSRSGRSPETLGVEFNRLTQCVTTLQNEVMRTRMQPVERVWNGLPRLVRRLGIDLGKRIEIEFSGGDVEIDRQMLELIKDPLSHMVRNAADHGLETASERRAAGKSEIGRIRVEATQEGGQIVIRMTDDGRGLGLDRLRQKAAALGLIAESEAERLSNREAAQLIFHPGLSTASEVTAISGRGVGMDVVRANLEKVGGSVEVETWAGRGTCFTLRIPLTLAIISALVAGIGGERFAVPQMAVLELVELGGDGPVIEYVHDAAVLRLRGALLPLVDVAPLLGLEAGERRYVVVAQAAGFRYGLIVDELFDTEEIVVKPVAPLLGDLIAYCGNAVLGDGMVAMILDAGGIATMAQLKAEVEEEEEAAAMDETDGSESLLLFHAGEGALMAVPLARVDRIEDFAAGAIQQAGGRALVHYRDRLVPVVGTDGETAAVAAQRQSVLMLGDGARSVGLAIDGVADIIEGRFDVTSGRGRFRLGNVVINGRVAELIDTAALVAECGHDGLAHLERAA